MSLDLVLGDLAGRPVTVAGLIALLETMDSTQVLGDLDGHVVTVADGLRRLRRTALLPRVVPVEDRLPEKEWAEAVIMRNEAPYGRCPFCDNALGAAGCLNLCDMPSAMAHEFNQGLQDVINQNRARVAWLEALGGCTCEAPKLFGYQTERESHHTRCPMATRR